MLARLPAWKKMGYPGKMGINVQRGGDYRTMVTLLERFK